MKNQKNKTEAEKVVEIRERAAPIDAWDIWAFGDKEGHYINLAMVGKDGKIYNVVADIQWIEEV